MPTSKTLVVSLLALAFASVGSSAQLESFKIDPTVKPQLSPVMLMEGVTEGRVILAVDVSAEGKLTDWLVLATTHPALVQPCVDALQQWPITPARIDGEPVRVQTELTINYKAEGVVLSTPAVLDVERMVQQRFGYPLVSHRRLPAELDRPPTVVNQVTPQYPLQAKEQGVRGSVRVHFYIDETGAVRMPSVEGDAHPYLADRAIAALREWRFTPPTAKGKPVLVAARQEFNFNSAH